MNRRRLLVALAAALPFAAWAQRKARRVALLSIGASDWQFLRDALEGSSVMLDERSAEGRFDRLQQLAADIAHTYPDAIVAHETPAIVAARKASERIPIVMAGALEPVAGANVTGIVVDVPHVAGRSIDLIRELKSNARRIALLASAEDPSSRALLAALNKAAARIRVPVGIARVRTVDDYEAAFAQWQRLGLQALIVHPAVDPKRAAELALRDRLPALALAGGFVEAGGLLSYAADRRALARKVANYIDRLLTGAKPAALAVETFSAYELALNLKTARAIDVELSDGLLSRADAIIQ